MQELKPIEMGHYPELSVVRLYDEFGKRPTVQPYMPPKLCKGKTVDKKYFFNVVNTLHEGELASMLEFANK